MAALRIDLSIRLGVGGNMGAGKHTDRLFAPGIESAYAATDEVVSLDRARPEECFHDIIVQSCDTPIEHLRVDPSGHPSIWERAGIYGYSWLPAFGVLLLAERFVPILSKLQQKGDLPPLTDWLTTFLLVNISCYHLPAIIGVLAVIEVSEVAVFLLRHRHRGGLWSYCCVWAVALLGFATMVLIFDAATSFSICRYPGAGPP
jgi:hypothetical protein